MARGTAAWQAGEETRVKYRIGTVQRLTAPIKVLAQRFAFLALLSAAVAVMILGRADPQIFERARAAVTDFAAPILDAISRPVATVSTTVDEVDRLADLRAENARLLVENQRLLEWQNVARQLEAENLQLKQLMEFVPDQPARYITVRVVGDTGGSFIRSLLVSAGRRDGVAKGQAAMTGTGLIGRVAEVGERSARILLITDLNSRIPVLVEKTRARAVLAGDNSNMPRLEYLTNSAQVALGDRIVTSGYGQVFPPGLPVGTVVSAGDSGIRVQPFSTSDRLEFVRLADFGLTGVLGAHAGVPRISGAPPP